MELTKWSWSGCPARMFEDPSADVAANQGTPTLQPQTHLNRLGRSRVPKPCGMAGTEVVKDVKCLLACVLRMHLSNEAVVFWNATREFRMMLRNDPDEPGVLSFELCLAPSDDEEEDEGVSKVLQLEHEGYFDEGLFVLDSFSYQMDEAVRSPELLDGACARINQVHAYSICRCSAYFIKDAAKLCLFCQMSNDAPGGAEHFCAICHESSIERHMVKKACCGQMLHRACLATWEVKSSDSRCPLCRAVGTHLGAAAQV